MSYQCGKQFSVSRSSLSRLIFHAMMEITTYIEKEVKDRKQMVLGLESIEGCEYNNDDEVLWLC